MMRFILPLLFILVAFPHTVFAAEGKIFLDPKSGVYRADEKIELVVRVNTDQERVSAIEGELAYNPKDFEVVEVTTAGSILTTWSTPPSYDGASGQIYFSGWADVPYVGDDGLLLTLHLRALRPGQSAIVFNSGAILSAQSRGDNILTTMVSGGYTISPKQQETLAPEPLPERPVIQNVDNQSAAALKSVEQESQTAALINSGVEIAPLLLLFFGALVTIAFIIAYVLHKRWI